MLEEKPLHAKSTSYKSHYAAMGIEPIEVADKWMRHEQYVGYLYGNIIKYIGRFNIQAPGKGGLPDLLKALDYLERLIQEEDIE